jgi:hypothetical protein
VWKLVLSCWELEPSKRPTFAALASGFANAAQRFKTPIRDIGASQPLIFVPGWYPILTLAIIAFEHSNTGDLCRSEWLLPVLSEDDFALAMITFQSRRLMFV